MRTAKWFIAIGGVVGLAFSIVQADDGFFERYQSSSNSQPPKRGSVDYYSRSGASGSSTPTKDDSRTAPNFLSTEKGANAISAGGANPALPSAGQTPTRYTRRRDSYSAQTGSAATKTAAKPEVRNFYNELFGNSKTAPKTAATAAKSHAPLDTTKSAGVIQAEYRRPQGTTGRNSIQQIRAIAEGESPFKSRSQIADRKTDPRLKPAAKAAFIPPVRPRAGAKTTGAGFAAGRPFASTAKFVGEKVNPATPGVSLKWVKRTDVNVGLECQCDLLVENTGKVVVRDVVVDAYFPQTVRLTSAKPTPAESQDHLSWKFATMAPGETHIIEIKMIPSQRGELATTANVRFTGTASNVFRVEEPLLEVVMKGPSEVMLGDSASQVVTVSNPGTGVAQNVSIEVRIPKGLEHPRGEKLEMEIGSLNPGESRAVRLSLAAIDGGEHVLQVQAKADLGLRQAAVANIKVVAPSIAVAIDGPGLRYLGRNARYTIAVKNDGSGPTNNVRVLQKIPTGFKFVKADKGGKWDSSKQTINWFVGRLDAGEAMKLNVELETSKIGDFVQSVRAMSEHGALSSAQAKTRVEGTASLLLEIVDLDDPVEVGKETAYEIRVRNDGSKAAHNVGVSCELPNGVQLISAKGASDHVAESGVVVFKALPQLPPGKTALYRIHVKGADEGNLRFRARLTSDSIQQPLIIEELTKFYAD